MPRLVVITEPGNEIITSPRSPKTGLDAYTKDSFKPTCCCPFSNPESVGYVLASLGNAAGVMSNIFLSAAILEMANRDAGCGYLHDEDYLNSLDDEQEATECKGRVYGQRPATIYLLTTTLAALCVAALNPFVGSVIDNTRFRKEVGFSCLLGVAGVQFAQIAILDPSLWFFVCLLQVPAIVGNFVNLLVLSAYLPELADTQEGLNHAASWNTLALFSSEMSFVVVVASVSVVCLESDNLATAAFSQGLAGFVVCGTALAVYGVFLKKRDKPKVTLRHAVGAGLSNLKGSWAQLSLEFPFVRRYLIGTAFAEASLSSFSAIASVYMVNQLGATGAQLAMVIFSLLLVGALFTPVADQASRWCGKRWGDEHAGKPLLCGSLFYFALVTEAAPFVLVKRKDLPLAFVFAVLWGAGMAFYYSTLKPIYFFIVPGGEEAKFSGLFTLFQVIIAWAPLLFFSVAYEWTGSLAGGFHCLAVFMLIAGLIIYSVDVPEARKMVLRSGTLAIREKMVRQTSLDDHSSSNELERSESGGRDGGRALGVLDGNGGGVREVRVIKVAVAISPTTTTTAAAAATTAAKKKGEMAGDAC